MIKTELLKQRLQSRMRYTFVVCLIAAVVVGYTIFDLVAHDNDMFLLVFNYVLIAFASFIFLFDIYILIGTAIDLANLKKDKYIKITAKFTQFNKKIDNKGTQMTSYTAQVFVDTTTGKEEILDVMGVQPGNTYIIIYSKHSRLGIPIEKVK